MLGKAYRTVLNLLCIGLAVLWTAFCAVTTLIAFMVSEEAGHRWHRRWARVGLWLLDVEVHYEGFDRLGETGASILASNHESMWDILVLAAMPYDFKWIAKKEVGQIPLFGPLFRRMGSFFVSRDRSGKDLNVMREVEEGLKRGKSIVIFPEGTRTRTGDLLPLKKGAFRTAQNSQRPLVPVAITGTRNIAPPGALPSTRGHRVIVRIGAPVPAPRSDELGMVMDAYRHELTRLLAMDRMDVP